MLFSSSFVQKSAILSALAISLVSPAILAQSSSSADYAAQATPSIDTSNLDFRTQYQNQYPSGGGYHQYKGGETAFSHIAVEAGVGFAVPLANTTDTNTTGYSFLAGGGWNFTKHFGAMLEYRFDDLGIQNSILTNLATECNDDDAGACSNGVTGSTHAWSFTVDPVYNIHTKGHWGGYVTGGGGFYRLLTSFNTPVPLGEECYYYCYEAYGNALVAHSSSNQGGFDAGGGVTWKPNPDQHGGLFADVRYEWLDSPNGNSTTGSNPGKVQILPVTFGYRW
jgi:opacity protein-like surface antigen